MSATKLLKTLCVLVCGTVLLATPTIAQPAPIAWQSGPAELAAQTPTDVQQVLATAGKRAGQDNHIVVQFDSPLTAATRARLAANGLHVLNSLGAHAFFARIDHQAANPAALAATDHLVAAEAIHLEWKLHPAYTTGVIPEWSHVRTLPDGTPVVAAYVLLHRDVDLFETGLDVVDQYGGEVRSLLEAINGLVVELPADLLPLLAAEDTIQWIEPPLPKWEMINDGTRSRTGANVLHAAPYNLDGTGVTVLVYDGGTARSTHVDFEGRLTVHDSSGMHYHPTHVAGTIGGAGVANATYKGMAPGTTLLSYGFEAPMQAGFLYTDPGDLEDDYHEAITSYGAVISNNSIGTNTAPNGFPCDWEGDYGPTSQLIDTIVRGDGSNPLFSEPFRIIWANGNERSSGRCGTTYHTTAPPACAKNHITVGALDHSNDTISSFSSWGPADDGRMKPDVSAPGVDVTSCGDSGDTAYTTLSGTSMACPATCGCGALIIEDYLAQFPDRPLMRNSTLKVFLAHTAVDRGNVGPDYQYGYGSIRCNLAVDFMRTENFLEASVGQGETYTVLANVNAGEELKVTLAWDDVPGATNTIPELVNDLDLRVYDPSGIRHYPWTLGGLANPSAPAVRTQENHVDNIEQVLVDAGTAQAGTWTIEVYAYDVPEGPQPFSLGVSPQLVACSSAGTMTLDRNKYGCEDTASLQVIDCDLNLNPSQPDTTTITVTSDTEPAGETVVLTETGPETADFRGTLTLSGTDSIGVLWVRDGDTVTATYIDADDGSGGTNVPVIDTATVDCLGPTISNVQVSGVDVGTATVTFNTNEEANGTVYWGLSCGALNNPVSEGGYHTAHSIQLNGLPNNTTVFFAVEAADEGGNTTWNDNGGVCYQFTTPDVNDNCSSAWIACPGVYTDSTAGMTNDGSASCGSSNSTADVWYKYKPASSGTLSLLLCDSSFDTVVSVHTGCPGSSSNQVGCNDDTDWFGPCHWLLPTEQSALDVSVSAGQTYYIRISGNSQTGTYVLDMSGPACAAFDGACCYSDGSCVVTEPGACTGDYQGDGTDCSPNPCPQPDGACCYSDGSCVVTEPGACTGDYQGDGTDCSPNPCPQPDGACCAADGGCTVVTEAACSGTWLGVGTTCDPNPCPQPGACCYPDGNCALLLEADCTANWLGVGTNCSPNPCPQPQGACCAPDGTCTFVTEAACADTWLGIGTTCDPNPCPQPWCLGDMNCSRGAPDFADVLYFVAALNGEDSWIQYHLDHNGTAPECDWLLGDYSTPLNGVEFSDIEPFANSVGQDCVVFQP